MVAAAALDLLKQGNARYVASGKMVEGRADASRRAELVSGQSPLAVVIGCADSRVAPEVVFDQGLGDLFVIRVAGNIATPATIGSLEYAIEHLGTRLVVVLGHQSCGAVQATLQHLDTPIEGLSPHLASIVEAIEPAVASLAGKDINACMGEAVRSNVGAVCKQLPAQSDVVRRLMEEEGLKVVGAEYSLDTGVVAFH